MRKLNFSIFNASITLIFGKNYQALKNDKSYEIQELIFVFGYSWRSYQELKTRRIYSKI